MLAIFAVKDYGASANSKIRKKYISHFRLSKMYFYNYLGKDLTYQNNIREINFLIQNHWSVLTETSS